MKPQHEKGRINWIESADSTNDALRRHIPQFDNLSVIAARRQTAGRGQGDHRWFSSPDTNLTFSVLYRFDAAAGTELLAADNIIVTQITTLAIRRYLERHGVEVRVKWPNDIWVGEKKICGILIENILEGPRVRESIVGIGLNLNETGWPSGLPNPVSLRELTGRTYSPEEELEALHEEIRRCFLMATSDSGRKTLDEKFRERLFSLGGERP